MSKPVTFTTSGTVQVQDGIYLTRQADEELFQLCRDGRYAYILTSRQMGKSSLMVATAERLKAEGVQTAIVDLQRLGAQTTTTDKWYYGLLTELARKLRLLPELMEWWDAHANLGEAQRLVQFLEDVVLPRIQKRLVVFIDEIDSTLSLDFTDDFFIALRYCFTARAENPDFEKLSFVLIGVATPNELIADQKRTPFNIGTLVELNDFTYAEAHPLAEGLGLSAAASQQVLGWILRWTGGHPYLTQRVCEAVVQQAQLEWSETAINELIGQLFFGEQREQDNNLKFVHSMLVGRAPDEDVLGVLGTYRTIHGDRRLVLDEDQSILKAHLKLSGIVKRVGTSLQVRNPIYWEVFDRQWIREQWPETWWERLKPAMPLIAGLTGGLVLLGGLSAYALSQRNAAVIGAKLLAEAARQARAATQEAENARDAEAVQRQQAEAALEQAEAERKRAVEAERAAEQALVDAQAAEKLADERRQQAEAEKQRAEQAQGAEAEQRKTAELRRIESEERRLEAENARRARDLNGLANDLVRQQRYEEAIPIYREAISLAPEYSDAYYRLGLTLSYGGQDESAISAFERAIDYRESKIGYYHIQLGFSLIKVDRFEDAIDQFELAIQLEPDSSSEAVQGLKEAERRIVIRDNPQLSQLEEFAWLPQNEPLVSPLRSTVRIVVSTPTGILYGSGFVIARSGNNIEILTTRSVVSPSMLIGLESSEELAETIEVDFFSEPPEGRTWLRVPAELKESTSASDELNLAVLTVKNAPVDIQPVEISSTPAELNSDILIIGHSYSPWTISRGYISQRPQDNLLQFSGASIDRRDSGGPIFNGRNNQVLGIVTTIEPVNIGVGREFVGVTGYGIPSSRLLEILADWGVEIP